MVSTIPPPEVLQSTILLTLDKQGSIADTRELELTPPGTLIGPSLEAQNAVKGVLDSLLAKEVSYSLNHSRDYFSLSAGILSISSHLISSLPLMTRSPLSLHTV